MRSVLASFQNDLDAYNEITRVPVLIGEGVPLFGSLPTTSGSITLRLAITRAGWFRATSILTANNPVIAVH